MNTIYPKWFYNNTLHWTNTLYVPWRNNHDWSSNERNDCHYWKQSSSLVVIWVRRNHISAFLTCLNRFYFICHQCMARSIDWLIDNAASAIFISVNERGRTWFKLDIIYLGTNKDASIWLFLYHNEMFVQLVLKNGKECVLSLVWWTVILSYDASIGW